MRKIKVKVTYVEELPDTEPVEREKLETVLTRAYDTAKRAWDECGKPSHEGGEHEED